MRKLLFAALILIMMSCTAFALDGDPAEGGEGGNPEQGQPISLSEVEMALDETVFYKTGLEIVPVPVLKHDEEIISEQEYSLQYSDNINVGTAKVTATFEEGTFEAGTKEVYFEILPGKPLVPAISGVNSSRPNVTVTWMPVGCTGYELQVSLNSNFAGASVYNQTAVSRTMANMLDGRTYYFRVRAYNTEKGKTTYGDWSTYSSKVNTTGEVGDRYCLNGAFISDMTVKVGENHYYYNTSGIKCACSKTMWNKVRKKSSKTKYLIAVDCDQNRVCVYKGKKNKWALKYYWKCTTGTKNRPTIKGSFKVKGKVSHFGEAKGYTCWYATKIKYEYYFHSVLYKPYSKTQIRDGRLGKKLSHGCIRLSLNNAKWIYKKCKRGTKIVIY